MAKAHDAALAVKRLAVQFEGLIAAAAVLDEIGSTEQHLSELKGQIATALAEADKAKKAEKTAKEKLDAVMEKEAVMVNGAKVAADELIKMAEVKASEIERAAQDKAAAMVAQASMEQSRISAANADNINKARAELNEISAARDTAAAQADAKAKELADIEKALEKAKAKIAQLIA
jgi:chromosome segregation ATPase